jgi:putative flippase GtrA
MKPDHPLCTENALKKKKEMIFFNFFLEKYSFTFKQKKKKGFELCLDVLGLYNYTLMSINVKC